MNQAVDGQHRDPAEVVREFRMPERTLKSSMRIASRWTVYVRMAALNSRVPLSLERKLIHQDFAVLSKTHHKASLMD